MERYGFIELERDPYNNIPSKEETERFEEYMWLHVTQSNLAGVNYNGSGFFEQDDPDDLALTFEKELDAWCQRCRGNVRRYGTKEVVRNAKGRIIEESYVDVETVEDVCERLEKNIQTHLNHVIRQHLERTGGKIGHFPFSGKRVLMTLTDDDDGATGQVTLDPLKLDWVGPAQYYGIRILEDDTPTIVFQEEKPAKSERKKRDPIKHRAVTFAISAIIFLITFVGTLIVNSLSEERNLTFLMLVSDVLFVSAAVAVVSLIRLIKALREKNKKNDYYAPTYRRDNAVCYKNEKDLKLYVQRQYEYLVFQQLWSVARGKDDRQFSIKWFFEHYRRYIKDAQDFMQ